VITIGVRTAPSGADHVGMIGVWSTLAALDDRDGEPPPTGQWSADAGGAATSPVAAANRSSRRLIAG
jgi:hypothetical protein